MIRIMASRLVASIGPDEADALAFLESDSVAVAGRCLPASSLLIRLTLVATPHDWRIRVLRCSLWKRSMVTPAARCRSCSSGAGVRWYSRCET